MPPKKKAKTENINPVVFTLTQAFLKPKVTVNTLLEAFKVREEKATNADLWNKLSQWTLSNGEEEKQINLTSFESEDDALALNYDLNEVFNATEEPETTTEVVYSELTLERHRQIENAIKLEKENAKKGKVK